jgi:hypothetical protein
MRKLAITTVLLAALALAGCGGSDDQPFVGTGTTTTGSTTGTGTTTTSSSSGYAVGNGSGSSFDAGKLAVAPTSIGAGGSATITASVVNTAQANSLYSGTAVTVVFNSPCFAAGTATIAGPVGSTLPPGTVSTLTGTAEVTYTAMGCSGSDTITATASVTNSAGTTSTLTATGTITIAAAAVGSIQFVSATPATIGLKGTGLNQTSTVIFKVVDSSGGPRSGVTVDFSLNTTVGGLSLSADSAVSANNGTVQTIVNSGTVHTTVAVTASIASPALSTNSSVLSVTTGLPASKAFSIATGQGSAGNSCPNVEGYNIDGITVPIVARLADRYNNPAPDGTAVAFTTDGGHIDGNCTTPMTTPGDGACQVTWTSANPRPVPADDSPPILAAGRTTVLATAIGEESFTDLNGSGFYVSPDPFDNIGEPYRDDNENGRYDLGEYFLDFLHTGVYAAADGTFHGIICTGSSSTSTCTTNTWAIGASLKIMMSTGGAIITVNSIAGTAYTPGSTPTPFNQGQTVPILFNITDLNGNPIPAGSTINVTASGALGSVTEGTFTEGCTTHLGGDNFQSILTAATAPGSGDVTIAVVSPSGVTTTLNIPNLSVN